jgi:hypothetical protein
LRISQDARHVPGQLRLPCFGTPLSTAYTLDRWVQ